MPPDSWRIVHLLPSTDDAGAENQTRYLLAELIASSEPRMDPELVYFREGRAHERFEALGLPLHSLASRGRLVFDCYRRARLLRSLYADRPPDILHTWLYEANVVGAIAAMRWPATRVILGQRSGTVLLDDRSRKAVLRLLRHRVDFTLANSSDGVRFLTALGYDQQRIRVVPNAMPGERVRVARSREVVRRELGIQEQDPTICTVARPDPTKDLPGLMRAVELVQRSHPKARLVLVGPTTTELEQLGARLPPGSLALGWQDDPVSLMAACDIVAIPSWTEGHSNVADEALMLGLPVVTTDTGEHPALVSSAGGRTVPIRNVAALAQAISELIDDPPHPAEVQAAASRALDPRRAAEQTIAVYRQLLDEKS